jgi:hypothetical protein
VTRGAILCMTVAGAPGQILSAFKSYWMSVPTCFLFRIDEVLRPFSTPRAIVGASGTNFWMEIVVL